MLLLAAAVSTPQKATHSHFKDLIFGHDTSELWRTGAQSGRSAAGRMLTVQTSPQEPVLNKPRSSDAVKWIQRLLL